MLLFINETQEKHFDTNWNTLNTFFVVENEELTFFSIKKYLNVEKNYYICIVKTN